MMLPADYLRIERRSYIWGTLVVMCVALAAIGLLQYLMEPGVYALPLPSDVSAMMDRLTDAAKTLTTGQLVVLQFVQGAAAVALFFLNWRFSLLIARPRSPFQRERGSWAPRLAWCTVLVIASMLYTLVLPQIVVTVVLAHWGSQEIRKAQAATPPPAPVTTDSE